MADTLMPWFPASLWETNYTQSRERHGNNAAGGGDNDSQPFPHTHTAFINRVVANGLPHVATAHQAGDMKCWQL